MVDLHEAIEHQSKDTEAVVPELGSVALEPVVSLGGIPQELLVLDGIPYDQLTAHQWHIIARLTQPELYEPDTTWVQPNSLEAFILQGREIDF